MIIFGIVLGIAFFVFLAIMDRQATEAENYLDEIKILQNHDLYD